jgi:hypothetical protein
MTSSCLSSIGRQHFVLNGVIRGVDNGCVCGCRFTEYVCLNFVVLSDEKYVEETYAVIVFVGGCEL